MINGWQMLSNTPIFDVIFYVKDLTSTLYPPDCIVSWVDLYFKHVHLEIDMEKSKVEWTQNILEGNIYADQSEISQVKFHKKAFSRLDSIFSSTKITPKHKQSQNFFDFKGFDNSCRWRFLPDVWRKLGFKWKRYSYSHWPVIAEITFPNSLPILDDIYSFVLVMLFLTLFIPLIRRLN